MYGLILYREDKDNRNNVTLPVGEHVIGRGPLLACTSKKVSRNHGLIRVTPNEGAFLVATHHNPCFHISKATNHMTVVKNGCTVSIGDGDRIALLPDEYWFRVQIDNTVKNDFNLTNCPSVSHVQSADVQTDSIEIDETRLKRDHSESTIDENPRKKRKSVDFQENVDNNLVQNDVSSSRSSTPDLLEQDNLDGDFLQIQCNAEKEINETSEQRIDVLKTDSEIKIEPDLNQIESKIETAIKIPESKKESESIIQLDSLFASTSRSESVIKTESDTSIRPITSESSTTCREIQIFDNLSGEVKDEFNIIFPKPQSNTSTDEELMVQQDITEDIQNISREFNRNFEENTPEDQGNVVVKEEKNEFFDLLEEAAQEVKNEINETVNIETDIKLEDIKIEEPELFDDNTLERRDGPSTSHQDDDKSHQNEDKPNQNEEKPNQEEEKSNQDLPKEVEETFHTIQMNETVFVQGEGIPHIVNGDCGSESTDTRSNADVENDTDRSVKNEGADDNVQGDVNDKPSTSGTSRRERCWYGAQCYRKNPQHKSDLSHPGDDDYDSDPNDTRPVCSFGSQCYRKNKLHRQHYRHPGQTQPPKDRKPKTASPNKRRKTPNQNPQYTYDSEDDYDYSDPFLNDGSSDEYETESLSSSDEESETEDESQSQERKRMIKEAKKFTRGTKKK